VSPANGSSTGLRIALVGATGVVGTTMLEVMHSRGLPVGEVVPFASERSAGRLLPFGDRELAVRALDTDSIAGFDVALFFAGGTISRNGRRASRPAGVWWWTTRARGAWSQKSRWSSRR
jgi:aspartate-semialdehyde dehydrogenase